WLGGVFVGSHFRRQGIGATLCAAVEEEARSRGIQTLYLFTLDKQVWYSRMGWIVLGPCVWHQRSGEIMCKRLHNH
ncbi:MAG: GNAT family N-acetyltransferase, partial [Candidatus Udaeobacter sp.]